MELMTFGVQPTMRRKFIQNRSLIIYTRLVMTNELRAVWFPMDEACWKKVIFHRISTFTVCRDFLGASVSLWTAF